MFPSLPPVTPPAAAHVVGEVAVGRDAPDEVGAEIAVQDAHPVLGLEREGRADRDRLLPAAVVERAGHLALPVEGEAALLRGSHHRHEPQQRGAIGSGEQLAQGFTYVGAPRSRAHAPFATATSLRISVRPSCLAAHWDLLRVRRSCRFGISSTAPTGRWAPAVPPRRPMSGSSRVDRPFRSLPQLYARLRTFQPPTGCVHRFCADVACGRPRARSARLRTRAQDARSWRGRGHAFRSRARDRRVLAGPGTRPGSGRRAARAPLGFSMIEKIRA